MTTIRQIHVDSRHCLAGGTAQKFDYAIPGGTLEIGSHMAAMITDVHMADVFPTIVLNQNDRLYWEEIPGTGQAAQQKVSNLDPGAYTALSLATEIQRVLNANTSLSAGFNNASPQAAASPWVVTYNSNDAVLEIKKPADMDQCHAACFAEPGIYNTILYTGGTQSHDDLCRGCL